MDKAKFQAAYKRIKEIGRRGSYDGPHVTECDRLTNDIYAKGTPAQKSAMTRLFATWNDVEHINDMAAAYGGNL